MPRRFFGGFMTRLDPAVISAIVGVILLGAGVSCFKSVYDFRRGAYSLTAEITDVKISKRLKDGGENSYERAVVRFPFKNGYVERTIPEEKNRGSYEIGEKLDILYNPKIGRIEEYGSFTLIAAVALSLSGLIFLLAFWAAGQSRKKGAGWETVTAGLEGGVSEVIIETASKGLILRIKDGKKVYNIPVAPSEGIFKYSLAGFTGSLKVRVDKSREDDASFSLSFK